MQPNAPRREVGSNYNQISRKAAARIGAGPHVAGTAHAVEGCVQPPPPPPPPPHPPARSVGGIGDAALPCAPAHSTARRRGCCPARRFVRACERRVVRACAPAIAPEQAARDPLIWSESRAESLMRACRCSLHRHGGIFTRPGWAPVRRRAARGSPTSGRNVASGMRTGSCACLAARAQILQMSVCAAVKITFRAAVYMNAHHSPSVGTPSRWAATPASQTPARVLRAVSPPGKLECLLRSRPSQNCF